MAHNKEVYISDHSDVVLQSHSKRSAADSAAYLLPFIRPHMRILDIGCGPGSITADLAALVPEGHVIGIDNGTEVVEKARAMAVERGLKNIDFHVGDAHKLEFADRSFDVVHAHQVLLHIEGPSRALREWRRVTKLGGLVACREWDCQSAAYYPEVQGVEDFWRLYRKVARSRGGEPNGGRHLIAWARVAGFERSSIAASASVWCYSNPEERAYWSNMWIDRLINSSLRKNLLKDENTTEENLSHFIQAVRFHTNKLYSTFQVIGNKTYQSCLNILPCRCYVSDDLL